MKTVFSVGSDSMLYNRMPGQLELEMRDYLAMAND
jgi:hypothetical protein